MFVPPPLADAPFTWAQAKALGVTRAHLERLLDTRQVVRVLRGVYRPADVPDTIENRARAAALVAGPFAVLCDRTAAWLHGVDTFEFRELEILPPLETVRLRGCGRIRRPECVGGERDLLPQDVETVAGVQVTTPVRTALDLGCGLPRRDALAALDSYMRLCGVERKQLYVTLPRYFRRRGVVQLRQLLPLADARSESPGESWTRMEIIDAGLPVPELQWWVYDANGRPLWRLDMAYPNSRVAVEYDGREFHDSDAKREHDRARRKWLRDRGWTVIVVTKDSFGLDALEAWIGELRRALRLGA